MKKPIAAVLSVTIALTGCATASKYIAADYVSSMQYQSYDCEQLASEMRRIQVRVNQLGVKLDEAASNDKIIGVVGVFLFWPALLVLGGMEEQEAEYSRLKGEYDAIQQAAVVKKCSVAVAPTPNIGKTVEEDVAKFRMLFADIPSYQRLVVAEAENVSLPVARTTVPPRYPMGLSSVRASVRVAFIVAEGGSVEEARVLETSDSRFADAAIESVKQWTFYPGLRNGKIDKFPFIIEIKFEGTD